MKSFVIKTIDTKIRKYYISVGASKGGLAYIQIGNKYTNLTIEDIDKLIDRLNKCKETLAKKSK